MKEAAETIDPRRAELESRRYHVTVTKGYDMDSTHKGEFYYDSERAARAFIRRQFAEWSGWYGFTDLIPRGHWRGIWADSALQAEIVSEEGETGCFYAQIVDKENPDDTDHPTVYFVDLRDAKVSVNNSSRWCGRRRRGSLRRCY